MKRVVCIEDFGSACLGLVLHLDDATKPEVARDSPLLGGLFCTKALQQLAVFVYFDNVPDRDRWDHVTPVADARNPPFLGQAVEPRGSEYG